MITAAEELAHLVGTAPACDALAVSRASLYRRRRGKPEGTRPRPTPPRALRPEEREATLAVLHSERFADKAPAQIWATLLDEGHYLCSIRTGFSKQTKRLRSEETN